MRHAIMCLKLLRWPVQHMPLKMSLRCVIYCMSWFNRFSKPSITEKAAKKYCLQLTAYLKKSLLKKRQNKVYLRSRETIVFWTNTQFSVYIDKVVLIIIHIYRINFMCSFSNIWFAKWICIKGAILQHMKLLLKLFITSCAGLILCKAVNTRALWSIDIKIKCTGFKQLFYYISTEFITSIYNPLNN